MRDVAAHALNLGLDWREVLEIDRGELDQLVESAIWQRAADLKHEEQRAFARMIAAELAPAFGGTRRMQSSTSTRHG